MEDFSHLFASHFQDNDRSLTNTLAGVIDHAVRFRANLPTTGPLAALLREACEAAEQLATRAQAAQQNLGLGLGSQKQAGTQTETATAKAFERVRKNEASLKGDLFIEDAAERQRLYALLYPTGTLAYYTGAALGTELADRLGEYLTRTLQEHEALGERFVKLVEEDLGPFRQVRNDQLAAQTTTNDARTTRQALVAELDALCDYDYHLLSAHFRADLARPALFWNPALYLRAAPRAAAGQVLNRAIQAGQHRQLFDLADYPQLTTLAVSLRDGGPVALALVPTATSPAPAATLPLAPGPPLTVPLADVPGTGTHLLAYNDTGKAACLDAQLS